MGLFSKKTCSVCGADIKLLGNTKLNDGNLCKECKHKLSAWFDDYRESTVEDIKKQLQLREANRKLLSQFNNTCAFGKFGCILIDENTKTFVALPATSDSLFGTSKIVTDISEIIDKNPDMISFSQVENVEIKSKVNQNELKHTVNGQQVSYNPKHFQYMCNFELIITINNHPYIRSMIIPLNDSALEIKAKEPRRVTTYAQQLKEHFTGLKGQDFDIENNADYRQVDKLEDLFLNKLKRVPDYSFGFKVEEGYNWNAIKKYQLYITQGEQIKRILGK